MRTQSHHVMIMVIPGPDLRGPRGPGTQASHQQRASHQTRHILFVVHASCLQNSLTHSLQKTEDVLILNP